MISKYSKAITLALTALVVVIAYALAPAATAAALPGLFDHHAVLLGAIPAFALLGDTVRDVFNQDAFGVVSLTDAINQVPFTPSRASDVIVWDEERVATTTVMFEKVANTLQLVNPTPRGAPGETRSKLKRATDSIVIPHYEINDGINADEVQGVRAFGFESDVQTVVGMVAQRQAQHTQLKLDPTLEYQRIGAIKGTILNGDGSTLYNLFTEFNVTQEAEVNFDLANASAADGALRKKCTSVVRAIATNLGGTPFAGVYGWCGDAFWDDLTANKEVRATYLNQAEAAQLRGNVAYEMLDFGGIRFENYRGAVGGSAFINTDKCHFTPVGVPGLFRTVYAPADYSETVNTIGLPRYSRQYPMENGKGVYLELQMNALSYCTRPKALMIGKRT